MEQKLKKLYTDIERPGAFASREKLYKAALAAGLTVSRDDVKDFLTGIKAYTLTVPRRYRFKRNKVLASSPNVVEMADLMDMQKLSKWNDGIKYVLVIICAFRRFVWCVPVKNKNAGSMRQPFLEIYAEVENRPQFLGTDKGKEFYNKLCQSLLKSLFINQY